MMRQGQRVRVIFANKTPVALAAVSILALATPAFALITITHCPPGHLIPSW